MSGGGGLPTLFETMRVAGGTLPLLDRHVERLMDACRLTGLLTPPDDLPLEARGHGLRPPADRVLRVSWDGAKLVWDDRDLEPAPPLRVVTVDELHPGYAVKSTQRAAFDRALEAARERGADEPVLLTGGGRVAETARYAIGWIEDERIVFPDLSLEILPSVGRGRVVELAPSLGLAVKTGAYGRAALTGRAPFLVNAVQGVVRVKRVDGESVPVDERIDALAAAFWPSA
ncbi:MAG TPA: aminotransferase class IV [Gemmatimonadales bacterium]